MAFLSAVNEILQEFTELFIQYIYKNPTFIEYIYIGPQNIEINFNFKTQKIVTIYIVIKKNAKDIHTTL